MRPWLLLGVAACACGASLRTPALAPHAASDFEIVPYPPPPALVELVPPAPRDNAVWIDGHWTWQAHYWTWSRGGWAVPPHGATLAPWQLEYSPDGTLHFAAAIWRNADGRRIPAPAYLAHAQRLARSTSGKAALP